MAWWVALVVATHFVGLTFLLDDAPLAMLGAIQIYTSTGILFGLISTAAAVIATAVRSGTSIAAGFAGIP